MFIIHKLVMYIDLLKYGHKVWSPLFYPSNEYSGLISFTDLLTLVSKFGKLSSGHRTGKGQFSFQSQRKEMLKNAPTILQLHSSHTLAK